MDLCRLLKGGTLQNPSDREGRSGEAVTDQLLCLPFLYFLPSILQIYLSWSSQHSGLVTDISLGLRSTGVMLVRNRFMPDSRPLPDKEIFSWYWTWHSRIQSDYRHGPVKHDEMFHLMQSVPPSASAQWPMLPPSERSQWLFAMCDSVPPSDYFK